MDFEPHFWAVLIIPYFPCFFNTSSGYSAAFSAKKTDAISKIEIFDI